MNDLLIQRAIPSASALIEAVQDHDADTVADILTTLDVPQLHALAIVLADLSRPPASEDEHLGHAIDLAARVFRVPPAAITGPSRNRELVDARAVVCYAGRLLGGSYSGIGRHLGRDHSTVMHACGRVGETPRLRRIATDIAERLGWNREDVA